MTGKKSCRGVLRYVAIALAVDSIGVCCLRRRRPGHILFPPDVLLHATPGAHCDNNNKLRHVFQTKNCLSVSVLLLRKQTLRHAQIEHVRWHYVDCKTTTQNIVLVT